MEYIIIQETEQMNLESFQEIQNEFFSLLGQGKEKEALDTLRDRCDLLLSNIPKNIYKSQGELYEAKYGRSFPKFDVRYGRKIDLASAEREAIKNLTQIVDEDLSSGDKMLIRDIAKKSIHNILERVSDLGEDLSLYRCTGISCYEPALYELETYGFKLKSHNIRKY